MKKGLIKAAVLLLIFVITLLITGRVTNKNQLDLTTEMEEPVLPVIMLYTDNKLINELYGYTSPMNAVGMRDTITPLSSSRAHGLILAAHEPFESTEAAIEKESDIHSDSVMVKRVIERKLVADTDDGKELKEQIEDLKMLLAAYRSGQIAEIV